MYETFMIWNNINQHEILEKSGIWQGTPTSCGLNRIIKLIHIWGNRTVLQGLPESYNFTQLKNFLEDFIRVYAIKPKTTIVHKANITINISQIPFDLKKLALRSFSRKYKILMIKKYKEHLMKAPLIAYFTIFKLK